MAEQMQQATYQTFDEVFEAIKADPQNADYTAAGIDPLYAVAADARVMVIGQAPGRVAQETRIPWN
ncbi:MAG: uracil-DNA glycosylase family protein, partial [Olegusella sp.]|nr:uracil-DNA glycosylase family protein [Olegusella sp.]